MEQYITKEEFQVKRTKAEFINWVNKKFEEIGKTDEGKSAVRFRKGLLQELVCEAYALSLLLPYLEDDLSTYECIIGNQNYDILIEKDIDGFKNEKLEITEAHEGEIEHHRMILLTEKGHVSTFGGIKKSGTKRTGMTLEEDEPTAHSLKDLFQKDIELIKNAFNKKLKKSYDENTSLLIMCRDTTFWDDDLDLITRLENFIETEICAKNDKFKEIYVLGWSGKILVKC